MNRAHFAILDCPICDQTIEVEQATETCHRSCVNRPTEEQLETEHRSIRILLGLNENAFPYEVLTAIRHLKKEDHSEYERRLRELEEYHDQQPQEPKKGLEESK